MPIELAMVLEFVKSQRGKPKLKHEVYLCCLLREKDGLKTWRCDKRQCKAIGTTFEDNVLRALTRTRYEALGATEAFRKDGREGRDFQRAAMKNCPRYNCNKYA